MALASATPSARAEEAAARGAGLAFEGVCRSFGDRPLLRDISLSVAPGEFLALVGASGSGKSTLLRIAAGLESADTGRVLIAGRDVTGLPPARRDVAMVFQDYALYPHLDVAGNLAMPLLMRRLSRLERLVPRALAWPALRRKHEAIRAEVREIAERMGLQAELHKLPGQLSGGQQQRTALGRAVIRRPAVFLMDEPLSNLDVALRGALRRQIRQTQKASGAACLYVTHDQIEALTMADRIAVLSKGRIVQCDVPAVIYNDPAHLDVLQIIGTPKANILPADLPGASGITSAERARWLAIRPERVVRGEGGHEPGVRLTAQVTGHEDHGHSLWISARTPAGHEIAWIEAGEAARALSSGDTVTLFLPAHGLWVFDAEGRRL